MAKRKIDESLKTTMKTSPRFKTEWLNEIVETIVTSSTLTQKIKLGDIFNYEIETGDVLCKICVEAKADSEFKKGKKWTHWKLYYLKRHLSQKVHLDSVIKLRNCQNGGIAEILTSSTAERQIRKDWIERKKSNKNETKILIDNVILAIKINTSMSSVLEIHEHMEKYIYIPKNWRSKNYAFEFVECINFVIQKQFLEELRESSFHCLIVDESTDISTHKALILYIKYRPKNSFDYKTVFSGILKLTGCTSSFIFQAIDDFYINNNINMRDMVMFTSDGASVMLGKNNGVATLLRRRIPHLSQQHCVAHKEDLGIDDAWKQVPLMNGIETLLKTVFTMFSRSTVKKASFEELASITECDALAYRPLNEVRWLSRHFAVRAFLRNYDLLIEYCTEEIEKSNDPICKYCLKLLKDPKYRLALMVLNDVLEELSLLCKIFQRSLLTIMDAMQFAKAKINKIENQYLGETVHWNYDAKNLIDNNPGVDTSAILQFIKLLCIHLRNRFPEEDIKDWHAFDHNAIINSKDFNFGQDCIIKLVKKYKNIIPGYDQSTETAILKQYYDFKFLIIEKIKNNSIANFFDLVNMANSDIQFKDLTVLLDICATFQASSADCERGFSLMNAIKSKSRNRLKTDNLDNLMRIKTFITSGGNINLDNIYEHWITNKNRREKY